MGVEVVVGPILTVAFMNEKVFIIPTMQLETFPPQIVSVSLKLKAGHIGMNCTLRHINLLR